MTGAMARRESLCHARDDPGEDHEQSRSDRLKVPLAVLACEFHAFARFLEQQEGQMNKSPPGVNDVVDEQTFRTVDGAEV